MNAAGDVFDRRALVEEDQMQGQGHWHADGQRRGRAGHEGSERAGGGGGMGMGAEGQHEPDKASRIAAVAYGRRHCIRNSK